MKNTIALVLASLAIFNYFVASNATDVLQSTSGKTLELSNLLGVPQTQSAVRADAATTPESQHSAKVGRGLGFRIELVDAAGYGDNRREELGFGDFHRREYAGHNGGFRRDIGYSGDYYEARRFNPNRREFAGYSNGGFSDFDYNGDYYRHRIHHRAGYFTDGEYNGGGYSRYISRERDFP